LPPELEYKLILRRYARRLFNRSWVLSGAELHDGASLTVLFSGRVSTCKYIRSLTLRDPSEPADLGRQLLTGGLIGRLPAERRPDILIAEASGGPPVLMKAFSGALNTPCWIRSRINVNRTLGRLENISALRGDLRRIRSKRLYSETSHEFADLEQFFRTMYLPYTLSRHGDRALPRSLDNLHRNWDNKALIKVQSPDDGWIGGQIVEKVDGIVRGSGIGVLEGDRCYLKMGVIAATYYFELLYAQQHGVEWVDYGSSRAFLNDGVLRYKRKWGAELSGCSRGHLYIVPVSDTPAVRSFLANNPFLENIGDHYVSNFFIADGDVSAARLDRLEHTYSFGPDNRFRIFANDREFPPEAHNRKHIEFEPLSTVFRGACPKGA